MPGAELPALTQAELLIHADRKIFYPSSIPLQHQQLRHFLSTAESGVVFWASLNEIYAFKDGKKSLIAWLDFKVQCLAVGHGWICAGGPEKGRCAFIPFQTSSADRQLSQAAEVDTLLPLGFRSLARPASPEGLRHLRSAPQDTLGNQKVYYKSMGEEIVNAITLQNLRPDRHDAKEEVVAVIATNDKNITIYSLGQMKALKTLSFKYAMNHASISPDSKMMVACGDKNRAFFFSRKELPHSTITGFAEYDWEELATPKLVEFRSDDHCFTTAFSPNGVYCTIGSQAGMMAKFEVSRVHADMKDGEAVVDTVQSSRPAGRGDTQTYLWRGAIRSTAFSPKPWDLLAWAESRGRVCVVDLRSPFRPPQVIEFTESDPTNIKTELADESSDAFDENFGHVLGVTRPTSNAGPNTQDRLAAISSAADYIEGAAYGRRLQQLLRSLEDEGSSSAADQPRLLDLMRSEIRELNEALDPVDQESSTRSLPIPRRRSSIVLGHTNVDSSSSHPSSLAPILPQNQMLSSSPSRLPSVNDQDRGPSTPPPPTVQQGSRSSSSGSIHSTGAPVGAAQTQNPRQASLEQHLHSLRETRNSLQRAERASRQRTEELARETEWWQRQQTSHTTESTTSNAGNSNTLTPSSSSADNRGNGSRNALDSDSRRRTTTDSTSRPLDRLRRLERDFEQSRSEAGGPPRLTRLVHDAARNGEDSANGSRGSSPTLAAVQSASRARYQRLLQVEQNIGNYLPIDPETAHFLRSMWDGGGADDELEIMGLSWSQDGRSLYVATGGGIFELKANLAGRNDLYDMIDDEWVLVERPEVV